MNKRSCDEKIRYFYFNDEYKEDIFDMIFKIHHINQRK